MTGSSRCTLPSTVLLALAIAVAAQEARADSGNSNRLIIPLGESEAFLGNTGVGRAIDTGAVYYNPSGLVEIQSGKVSVTGAVYMKFQTSAGGFVNLDSTNVPLKASGFNTIPATYVATRRFGDWVGALSVLVPSSLQLVNRAPFDTPNTHDNLLYNTYSNDLWFGLSLAHKLTDRLSIGLTLFGIDHSEQYTTGFNVQFPANPTTKLVTSMAQWSLGAFGASATLGLAYVVNDFLRFGVRAQSPFVQITGSADTYEAENVVTNGQVQSSGEDLKGTPVNYRMPFDFSLGTAVTPAPWATILLDVSLQLGATYSSIPGSTFSDDENLKPTPRVNLGAEFKPTPSLPIRVGFYYDPSANGGKAGDPGYEAENYFGITGGIGLNSGPVETGVGAFYLRSSGKLTPSGATGTSASLDSTGFGVLLTTSYLL
jgi:long-subunit fatty acid transport protein